MPLELPALSFLAFEIVPAILPNLHKLAPRTSRSLPNLRDKAADERFQRYLRAISTEFHGEISILEEVFVDGHLSFTISLI